jgi:hypothetical protein
MMSGGRRLTVAILLCVACGACGQGQSGSDQVEAGAAQEGGVDDFSEVTAPSIAWTGEALFVYAGLQADGPMNAAGLVDPESAATEELPPPPFETSLQTPVASVVTEGVAIVVGGECSQRQPGAEECEPGTYAAASIDLDARTWERLALPEGVSGEGGRRESLGTLSDGRAVFRFGQAQAPTYWVYSVPDDTWTQVPSAPERLDDACLAGDRLVGVTALFEQGEELVEDDPIATAEPGSGPVMNDADDGYVQPAIVVADLAAAESVESASWTTSAREGAFLIPAGIERPTVSCMADHAMVHDGIRSVAVVHAVDPARLGEPWPEMAAPPRPGVFDQSVWAGGELVFMNQSTEDFPAGGPAQAYDPVENRWRDLPDVPLSTDAVVWTGSALVGFPDHLNVLAAGTESPFSVEIG